MKKAGLNDTPFRCCSSFLGVAPGLLRPRRHLATDIATLGGWQTNYHLQEQPPSRSVARSSVGRGRGKSEQQSMSPSLLLTISVYSQSLQREGTSTRKLKVLRYLRDLPSPWNKDGRHGGDAFAKHASDLGLTDRSTSPLSVTPNGLFRGRRTKLPAGDPIGGGDSGYLGDAKTFALALRRDGRRCGDEHTTIPPPPLLFPHPLDVAPEGLFRERLAELPVGEAVGCGGPSLSLS